MLKIHRINFKYKEFLSSLKITLKFTLKIVF